MMGDTPERALAEAEVWLEGAKKTLKHGGEGSANVCCAQAIHGIIRTNDALALKFLGEKSTRHDDLPFLFRKMLKQNKIKSEERKFEPMLVKAMTSKSGADYGKSDFSRTDAKLFVKEAEEFIKMAKKYIEGEA